MGDFFGLGRRPPTSSRPAASTYPGLNWFPCPLAAPFTVTNDLTRTASSTSTSITRVGRGAPGPAGSTPTGYAALVTDECSPRGPNARGPWTSSIDGATNHVVLDVQDRPLSAAACMWTPTRPAGGVRATTCSSLTAALALASTAPALRTLGGAWNYNQLSVPYYALAGYLQGQRRLHRQAPCTASTSRTLSTSSGRWVWPLSTATLTIARATASTAYWYQVGRTAPARPRPFEARPSPSAALSDGRCARCELPRSLSHEAAGSDGRSRPPPRAWRSPRAWHSVAPPLRAPRAARPLVVCHTGRRPPLPSFFDTRPSVHPGATSYYPAPV